MEGAEKTKSHHLKKYAIIGAVAIMMIALAVGLTFGLKRRRQRKDLMVACKFLNINDLKVCQENKNFGNGNSRNSQNIPSEIGLLTQMTYLSLYGNHVFGTIPTTFGNLIHLNYLSIFETKLSGTIPSELGNLVQLNDWHMDSNTELTGTIPSVIGNMTQLSGLRLQDSSLSGTIPSELGALVKLTGLGLNTNQLTGTIPSTLANLTQLQYLSLQGNDQLGGTIPLSLCSNSMPGIYIGIYIDCKNVVCSCCSSSIYTPETNSITTANCSVA
jgi:hypothetical protein